MDMDANSFDRDISREVPETAPDSPAFAEATIQPRASDVNLQDLRACVRDNSARDSAERAFDLISRDPGKTISVLTVPFLLGDLQTADAILKRCGIALDDRVATEIEARLYSEGADERVHGLFNRYRIDPVEALHIEHVIIPETHSETECGDLCGIAKFMLLETSSIEGSPIILLRVGAPNHRDIVEQARLELVERGMPKAAQTLEQRGGGWVLRGGEKSRDAEGEVDVIRVSGASSTFGGPDYDLVEQLIAVAYPNSRRIVKRPQETFAPRRYSKGPCDYADGL